jgi:hypothetical protein
MRLAQSFTRKLAFLGILIAATAASYPVAAQYDACPTGYYLAPGYGCLPYAPDAYSPYYYDYAPLYGYADGRDGGRGHDGFDHDFGHDGFGHGFEHGGGFAHGGGHGGGGHGR